MRPSVRIGVALLAGCLGCHFSAYPGDGATRTENTVDTHRTQWESAQIPDYSWHVNVGCMACGDYKDGFDVRVVDGQAVSLHARDFRGDYQKLPIKKNHDDGVAPLTVEDLLDQLDQAYATNADVIQVSYDGTLGYPTQIAIDPSLNTSDDELEFTVTSLVPQTGT